MNESYANKIVGEQDLQSKFSCLNNIVFLDLIQQNSVQSACLIAMSKEKDVNLLI